MSPPERRAQLRTAGALGVIALASVWLPGVPGQIALYPVLGAFPGLAAAWLLLPRASATTRWIIGLALAPLLSSMAGWTLARLGLSPLLATLVIGAVSWLVWVARIPYAGVRGAEAPGEDAPPSRALLALALGLAATIATPHFLNPWMLVKSDAWTHAGVVYEILERGMPPEDPRFAGLRLNYVWFFNLFIGMLSSVRDGDPFVFMTTLNVVDVALFAALAYLGGWTLWKSRDGALGAALLACFGFNALAWLTWPLRGVHGLPAFLHRAGPILYSVPPFNPRSWTIMNDLGAPHTFTENFADKFVTGTSINYAWLLMMLWLWALLRQTGGVTRGAAAVALLASAGMQLWHGVVGLSVVPVGLCALTLLLLARPWASWLPPGRRLVAIAIATAGGFLLALPYTISISRGWDARATGLHVSPVHLTVEMTLTVVLSSAFALLFAWRPMREALTARRADGATLLVFAAGLYAFAILIALPNDNEIKFAIEAFIPLALFGGEPFLRWARGVRRRGGPVAAALLAAALLLPLALTLTGFTLDPERWSDPTLNPAPGENAFYAWLRAHSPQDLVVVDNRFRDLVMVRARRQLYLGSPSGPERAAFPLHEVIARRAVMADLYGPAASLDADADALVRLGRPGAVLYRAADARPGEQPGRALATRPDRFERTYDRDGFVLYAVRMPSPSTRGASR